MKTLLAFILVSFSSIISFADPMSPSVEPLFGVITSSNGVYIQAHSGGCTSKDSFVVKKVRVGSITEITFMRVEGDPCLALYTYGTLLNYSYEDLGLEYGTNFIVRNPLTFSKVR
jgi:hypothetical protein